MLHTRRQPDRLALRVTLLCLAASMAASTPAFADATFFIGSTLTPSNRTAKGIAIGAGLIVVGFEFEFSDTGESLEDAAPSLRTGMGNVLLQTPFPIAGIQFYFTTGTGIYRERLDTIQETHVGFNTGGGAKISVLGPIRARLDYRVFNLRGEPLHSTVHRLYAGLNVAF
jgi:opacity protein-like surface antigen